MNPQEEKDILTYLEGEITNNKGFIAINGINIESIFNSTDKQNMFIDFAITALINERERRKNEVFKPLENWENKPITPKKEE